MDCSVTLIPYCCNSRPDKNFNDIDFNLQNNNFKDFF